jgi:ribosomal protein S18 acetylase RimI-like enzyme
MGAVKPTSEGRFEVLHIRVESAHQRRGYGKRLMAELEARARALGARELFLNTTIDQEPAQRLYESTGYIITHRSFLQAPTRSYELVHYCKAL